MSHREFGSDGYAAEQLAFESRVKTASQRFYEIYRNFPDEQELELRGIDVRRSHFINGLTAFAMQVHVSLDVRSDEVDMPPALLAILPDIVDRRLRVTLVLQDLEVARRKGVVDNIAYMEQIFPLGEPEETPGFALILASQVPDCDRLTVGIPSDPDRGLFVVRNGNMESVHPRVALFLNLRGKRVPQEFMEAMLYGTDWFVRTIDWRLYREPSSNLTKLPVGIKNRGQLEKLDDNDRGRMLQFKETA